MYVIRRRRKIYLMFNLSYVVCRAEFFSFFHIKHHDRSIFRAYVCIARLCESVCINLIHRLLFRTRYFPNLSTLCLSLALSNNSRVICLVARRFPGDRWSSRCDRGRKKRKNPEKTLFFSPAPCAERHIRTLYLSIV